MINLTTHERAYGLGEVGRIVNAHDFHGLSTVVRLLQSLQRPTSTIARTLPGVFIRTRVRLRATTVGVQFLVLAPSDSGCGIITLIDRALPVDVEDELLYCQPHRVD